MRTADGTRLLSGGGIWDKRLNRWRTPEHLTVLFGDEIAAADQETLGPAHILTVEASQVEYVQAFGQWLKSYKRNEPRPLPQMCWREATWRQDLGNGCPDFARGGGHPIPNAHGWAAGYVCGWLVVPSYPEQRELHEDILAVIRAGPRTSATSKRARWCLAAGYP